MPSSLRTSLPITLVALLILMTLTAGAAATTEEDAVADPIISSATGGNADRVDGKHAVPATSKAWKRKYRLVAANSSGFLPSNIVKPKWALIKGKPAALADGQVSWEEVADMPGGFTDGVDDVGYDRAIIWSGQTPAYLKQTVSVDLDPELDVELSVILKTADRPVEVTEIVEKLSNGKLRHSVDFNNVHSAALDVSVRARAFGTKAQLQGALANANVIASTRR